MQRRLDLIHIVWSALYQLLLLNRSSGYIISCFVLIPYLSCPHSIPLMSSFHTSHVLIPFSGMPGTFLFSIWLISFIGVDVLSKRLCQQQEREGHPVNTEEEGHEEREGPGMLGQSNSSGIRSHSPSGHSLTRRDRGWRELHNPL